MKVKPIIGTVLLIVIALLILIGTISCSMLLFSRDFQEDIVEENILKLYKEHPDELNEFAELCLKYENIDIQNIKDYSDNYSYCYNLEKEYLYTDIKISESDLNNFKNLIKLFHSYGYDFGFSFIYEDERKGTCILNFRQGIWIFSRSVALIYQEKEIEEDDLRADSKEIVREQIDEHWYMEKDLDPLL